jgi:excisionase family DNA binding protein
MSALATVEREPLITVKEAAKRLSLSRAKVYDMLAKGELSSLKFGRARRLDPRAVEDLLARNRVN